MSEVLFSELKQLLVDNLSADVADISLEASLQDDLGADSLDAVELIMAIEDHFDLEIDSQKASEVQTVGDLLNLVESLQNC